MVQTLCILFKTTPPPGSNTHWAEECVDLTAGTDRLVKRRINVTTENGTPVVQLQVNHITDGYLISPCVCVRACVRAYREFVNVKYLKVIKISVPSTRLVYIQVGIKFQSRIPSLYNDY